MGPTENFQSCVKKVVLLGDNEVGKTTYVNALTTGGFTYDYIPTVDFVSSVYKNGLANIYFRDLPGDKFMKNFRQYHYDVDDAFIFCNMNDDDSIMSVNDWIAEFRSYNHTSPIHVCCIDKSDCKVTSQKNKLLKGEIFKWSKHCKSVTTEISSKTGNNIHKPLVKLFS